MIYKSIFIHFPDNDDVHTFIVEKCLDGQIIWSEPADTIEECIKIVVEYANFTEGA